MINSCWTLKVVVGDGDDLKKMQDKKNIDLLFYIKVLKAWQVV